MFSDDSIPWQRETFHSKAKSALWDPTSLEPLQDGGSWTNATKRDQKIKTLSILES